MTDDQIIDALKSGETLTFGLHGHNSEIMELMADLEKRNLIRTEDASLDQETRRAAFWIGPL